MRPARSERRKVDRSVKRAQSLKLGAAAQMLPLLAGYSISILTTPYVISRVGLHDFGVWAITGAIAQYAGLLDLGVSRSVNRHVALFRAKGDVKSAGGVLGVAVAALIVLGALLGGLAFLSRNVVDRLLGTGDAEFAALLLESSVAVMIVGLLARVFAAASIGRGRQVSAGVGMAIFSTFQAVGGAAVLIVRPSLGAFAIGTVVGATLGLVAVLAIIVLDERGITISWPRARVTREVLTFGINAQIAGAGDILLLQSGKLIAGLMIGPTAAGIYELANRLAVGTQAFGAAAAPIIMRHLAHGFATSGISAIVTQYEHLTRRNTAVAIFVPFAIAATAFSAIPLWLGGGKGEVLLVLLALLPGIAVNASTAVCSSSLMAIGRPGIVAQTTVIGGILQTALAVALGAMWGFEGIAVAFAAGVPAIKLISLWYMQARAGIPMPLYYRGACGPYAVGLVAMTIAMPIGVIAAPLDRQSAVGPFLASAVLFCVSYALLGWKRDYLPRVPQLGRGRRFSRLVDRISAYSKGSGS